MLLGVAVWSAAPLMAAFFRIPLLVPVLRVLAWSFPLKGFAAASEAVLFRDLRFRWLATRELVSYAVGYGVIGVTLAWLGFGVWALVNAHSFRPDHRQHAPAARRRAAAAAHSAGTRRVQGARVLSAGGSRWRESPTTQPIRQTRSSSAGRSVLPRSVSTAAPCS